MNYLIIALTALVAFFIGYQYCMIRNCVKEMNEFLQVIVGILRNDITPEEAQERIKKAAPWIEDEIDHDEAA